jgi:PKHD-type hydroxylase
MSWLMKDFNYSNEAFAYATNCFTQEEINEIIKLGETSVSGGGELENGISNLSVRNCKISWIEPNENSTSVFLKLSEIVNSLNDKFYRYDLTEMESLQFTEYNSESQGFYRSHSDDGYKFNLFRKLSVSVQLSDPADYAGGDLVFYRNTLSECTVAPKEIGTVIVFPSFVIHEVKKITAGTRQSLVTWVNGPRFK